MNTMPWDYWQKDGAPKPATAVLMATLERVIAARSRPRRRAPLLHSLDRGFTHAGARRGKRRSSRVADAGGRTHGPHAGAHLFARRALRRRRRGERAGHRGRRGLPGAVPGAGAVSRQLLPAQPALPVGGGDAGRPKRRGHRRRPAGGGEGAAPPRRRRRLDGRLPGDAVARLRALRPVAADADRAEAARTGALRYRHLALRPRPWRSCRATRQRAHRRSWMR